MLFLKLCERFCILDCLISETAVLKVRLIERRMSMDSGAEIYLRFLGGDDECLTELVKLYRDGLIMFLNSIVHNMSTAEELAEVTFFRLAVKKPRFVKKYSFKTYLYTVGRNLALNYIKKNSRENVSIDECAGLPDYKSLEDTYLDSERKLHIHNALNRINADYAHVLRLVYLEGFTNSEAAKITGKSSRQIENLLYRAKKALKAELEREGFTYEDL